MSGDQPAPAVEADEPTGAAGRPAASVWASPWTAMRQATPARIGLGRVGDTLPLRPVLDLQLAHAAARDAVHAALDVDALVRDLAPLGAIAVRSLAPDRAVYLKRPDLGRTLDPADAARLSRSVERPCDCVFILADGLSALAVARHGVPVLRRCLSRLAAMAIGEIVVATQARVALGDAVGAAVRARACVVLIGERPGLSVADSLGAYVTFGPVVGRRDFERNCVSNIHASGGLCYDEAARRIGWLVDAALARGHSGVALKEASDAPLRIATDHAER